MAKREQRMVTIDRGDGQSTLEGIYVAPAAGCTGGAVVAAPHPLYGGSMDSPVVSEVAFACQRAELATLIFNWRGVGASSGTPSGDPEAADADYAAALAHLAETVSGELVCAGYSFGAAAAARACRSYPRAPERVGRLLLLAPPAALLDRAALEAFPGSVLVVAAEADTFAPPSELVPIVKSLPRGQLALIPEADHFFMTGLAELAREVAGWLASLEPAASRD